MAQNEDDEEVYELSPFTIDESETQGYLATSTLAGTRIKTDLRDIGAAISVVTAEFMDDIGATDAQTLLSYTSNTEVGGYQGNFAGPSDERFSEFGNNNFGAIRARYMQNEARTDPQLNTRIRGLGKADLTRGYFLTDIPFDSYNTDRVTVSRGPNSLLFGIGSPGGVVNNSTKQAVQGSDFGEFKVRFDNYSSWRTEIDYNKSLIDGRVALRVAVLKDSLEYKQEPAFEDQERFYGALDIVLFENESSDVLDATIFRFNGEDGVQAGSPVEVIPPTMAYHNWFEPIPANISQFTGGTPPPNIVSPSEGGTWQYQALNDDPLTAQANDSSILTNTHPSIFKHVGLVYADENTGMPNVGLPGSGLQGYTGFIQWRTNRGDTLGSTGLAGTPVAIATFGPDAPGDTPPWENTG